MLDENQMIIIEALQKMYFLIIISTNVNNMPKNYCLCSNTASRPGIFD
jgi:hypothetical protein